MFKRFLSDRKVKESYLDAGNLVGAAVSYSYMGEPIGFKRMVRRWESWEREYVRRGYRTISLDEFIESGGYGKPLPNLGTKREEGEEPVFHAQLYREHFLGKIEPVIDPFKYEIQTGFYVLPSTKKLAEGSKRKGKSGKRKKGRKNPKARKH